MICAISVLGINKQIQIKSMLEVKDWYYDNLTWVTAASAMCRVQLRMGSTIRWSISINIILFTVSECVEELSPPDHGQMMMHCDRSVGSQRNFSCDDGYVAIGGNLVRTCQRPGIWDGSPITCEGMYDFKLCLMLSYFITMLSYFNIEVPITFSQILAQSLQISKTLDFS